MTTDDFKQFVLSIQEEHFFIEEVYEETNSFAVIINNVKFEKKLFFIYKDILNSINKINEIKFKPLSVNGVIADDAYEAELKPQSEIILDSL